MSPPAPRGFSPAEVAAALARLRAAGGYGVLTVTVRTGAVVEMAVTETQRPGAAGPAAPGRPWPNVAGSAATE